MYVVGKRTEALASVLRLVEAKPLRVSPPAYVVGRP